MPQETILAKRYAKGLAMLAIDRDQVREVRDDLETLADLMDPLAGDISVPELMEFLRTPVMTEKAKLDLTDIVLDKLGIGKTVSDFLNVLILHRRVELMPFIVRSYNALISEMTHELAVVVETAFSLTDPQREEIADALAMVSGRPIRISQKIEPGLLAGIKIHIGDSIVDASALGRLNRMTQQLETLH